MAAHLYVSHDWVSLRPPLETATGKGHIATGARRKKFPPAKVHINFDLCIVYIRIFKGT
jgi:hypothetical protein